MINFYVTAALLSLNIRFRASDDQKKLDKWDRKIHKRFGTTNPDGFDCAGRCYQIYIDKQGFRTLEIIIRKKALSIDVVSHEVYHGAHWILLYLDMLSGDTEELGAILQGWITRHICQGCRDRGVELLP